MIDSTRSSAGGAAPQRRFRRRRLLRLAFVFVVVCPILLEGALRYALFGRGALAEKVGAHLRRASLFGDNRSDQVFWTLDEIFPSDARRRPSHFDPIVGWTSGDVLPGDYDHVDAADVGGRRPVVLYGDSFATCVTSRADCFQGLLERSDRRRDHKLLNYGSGGYGLDQTYLLMRESVGRFVERDPVVIVSCIGDDLDRCALSLRHWPKPRFHLIDGELALEPPRTADGERPDAPFATSYLWRWYLHGSELPSWQLRRSLIVNEREERAAKLRPVCTAIVLAARRLLVDEGVDHFFVFFPVRCDLRGKQIGWQEQLLVEVLEEHAIPFVNASEEFDEDRERSGRPVEAYFLPDGHYNKLGNEVAFQSILRGLARYADG